MKKYKHFECAIYKLDRQVLAVAVVGCRDGREKTIRTYIGAVKGKKHDEEYKHVLNTGSKLPTKIAEVIFPVLYNKYEVYDNDG